jgi:hypothetical protein
VLQNQQHGPELCLEGTTLSVPPGCSGVPLKGWDWARVVNEKPIGATTWGAYRVTGTYDGTTFTVATVRSFIAGHQTNAMPDLSTPCPTPPGGWRIVDQSKVKLEDYLRR